MHTAVLRDVTRRWGLTVGPPIEHDGEIAWVAPARDDDGRDLMLKIGQRHTESQHEADGLRLWNGDGAVRLRAAHDVDDITALLLERCVPGTTLSRALPEPEQDVVVAGLLRRLWRRAGAPFRPLSQMCDEWADECEPWLMIDPKPYVGDPAYDVLQHLLNCVERLVADPVGLAKRMAGLTDLDPERVTLWLFARCVQESPGWTELREVAVDLAP